jgi:hypothetical protein
MRESLWMISEIMPESVRESVWAYIGINELVDGC